MSSTDSPPTPRFASKSIFWSRAAIAVLLCGLVASVFGLSREWVCFGAFGLAILLEQRGIARSDALVDAILAKAKGSRKLLSDAEVEALVQAASVAGAR